MFRGAWRLDRRSSTSNFFSAACSIYSVFIGLFIRVKLAFMICTISASAAQATATRSSRDRGSANPLVNIQASIWPVVILPQSADLVRLFASSYNFLLGR